MYRDKTFFSVLHFVSIPCDPVNLIQTYKLLSCIRTLFQLLWRDFISAAICFVSTKLPKSTNTGKRIHVCSVCYKFRVYTLSADRQEYKEKLHNAGKMKQNNSLSTTVTPLFFMNFLFSLFLEFCLGFFWLLI